MIKRFARASVFMLLFLILSPSSIDAAISHSSAWGAPGSGDGQFSNPQGIAIDAEGNVYVADAGNNRIQKFTSDGTFILKWGSAGSGTGSFNIPKGIDVDSNGNVWVADYLNNRVQKFDSEGNFISSHARQWASVLAIDSDDNIYVGAANTVYKYDVAWNLLATWNGQAQGGTTFAAIYGVGFDTSDNVFVLEDSPGKVQAFSKEGVFIRSFTGASAGGVAITNSAGSNVSKNNFVYTTQTSSTRLQKFTTSGTFVEYFGSFSSGNNGFEGPNDVEFYGNKIYVMETGYLSNKPRVHVLTDSDLVDDIPSRITSVTSDKANGSYKAGDTIDIDVIFSETVTSVGDVTITLETGDVDRSCTFTIASSSTGTCNDVVQSGDTASSLTTYSISGTISDASGNAMLNFTPITNLAVNKALVIDTFIPGLSLVSVSPSATDADFTWTTDEAASSIVEYGLHPSYGFTSAEGDTSPRVTSHQVSLNTLKPCARYFFRLISKDLAGNQGASSQGAFTTSGCTASAVVSGAESLVTTASGGSVSFTNGASAIELLVPVGFSGQDATFQLNKLDNSSVPTAPAQTSLAGENLYNLLAVGIDNTEILSFSQDITFTITYGNDVESAFDENTLDVYKYSGGNWVEQNCLLDTSVNTLTCSLPSFSLYAVFGEQKATSQPVGSRSENVQSGIPQCNFLSPASTPKLFQLKREGASATLAFTSV